MEIDVRKSFSRDLDKITDKKLLAAAAEIIGIIEHARSVRDIKRIKNWRAQRNITGSGSTITEWGLSLKTSLRLSVFAQERDLQIFPVKKLRFLF